MTKRTLPQLIKPATVVAPLNTVSFLPPRTSKAKRTRVYKTRTVSFYLHPRLAERSSRVRAMIDEIADRESVLMDETKFAFVDYGAHCYTRGEIPFVTRPNPSVKKLTLVWEESDAWKREISARKKQTPPGSPVKGHPSFSFRGATNEQSSEMKKRVAEIAARYAVTPGEVVIVLLEYAVEQYVNGRMSLKKSQPAVEHKIDGWGEKTQ